MRTQHEMIRILQRPAYAYLTIAILLQLADFVLAIRPLQFSMASWRFQMLMAASGGVLANLLLLFFLLQLVAYLSGDERTLALIGSLALASAVVLLFCAVSFGFDALRVRRTLDPQLVRRFDTASYLTAFRFLAGSAVCALYGIHAWRAQTKLRTDRAPAWSVPAEPDDQPHARP